MLLVMIVIVGIAVGAIVGRWWVLACVLATPMLAIVQGGSYYADSGPRWALDLLFLGGPLALGLIFGVAWRTRSRPPRAES